VKLVRREPREVYRVYDAEDFLARADLELDAEGRARGGLVGVAGGLLLLLGAVSVLTGLFASHRRGPVRGAVAKQTFRGSRALRAAVSLGTDDSRGQAHPSSSRGAVLPDGGARIAIGSSARRSHRGPMRGTALGRVGSHPVVSSMLPSHEAAGSSAAGHLLVVAAASETSARPQGEFGFER
jgi:hypothetical protein